MAKLASGQDAILEAAQRLQQGRLVAFPTETVYGLGGDAENPQALARIYAVKQRPSSHPLIVHLAPESDPGYWTGKLTQPAQQLIAAFWPGPLTLILPRADHIPVAVSGGQDSIGLRCPAHPVAQMLLHAFAQLKAHGSGGVAAPSANMFGHVSPTSAAHVLKEFAHLSEHELLVLEGGAATVGIESTIIDVSRLDKGVPAKILRPGHIDAVQIAEVLGYLPAGADSQAPRVSGSLKAHYAPATSLVLWPKERLQAFLAGDLSAGVQALGELPGRIAVAALETAPAKLAPGIDWLVLPSDAGQYARQLYAVLHQMDNADYDLLIFQQPPSTDEWLAVNDRLTRAAAAF